MIVDSEKKPVANEAVINGTAPAIINPGIIKPAIIKHAVGVVYLLCLSLLLGLGGWQWWRGAGVAAVEKRIATSPARLIIVDRAPQNWGDVAYRRVRLDGDWRNREVFLLANRVHRGEVGYEVLHPIRLRGDDSVMLVNRGWITAAAELPAELQLLNISHPFPPGAEIAVSTIPPTPSPTSPPEPAAVTGRLYLPQTGFTLGPAYRAQDGWPKVIQYFDVAAAAALLGVALQPAALALDPDHPAAFERIWRADAMTSARHFGYAAQWWGLALTLIVFGVIWRRR